MEKGEDLLVDLEKLGSMATDIATMSHDLNNQHYITGEPDAIALQPEPQDSFEIKEIGASRPLNI